MKRQTFTLNEFLKINLEYSILKNGKIFASYNSLKKADLILLPAGLTVRSHHRSVVLVLPVRGSPHFTNCVGENPERFGVI